MGERILVVDGDAYQRAKLCRQLTDAGFAAEGAANGDAGLALYAAAPPDLTLIDISASTKGGVLAATKLCATKGSRPPVLAITPAADRLAIEQAFEIGADHFVFRPISRLILIHHIRHLLRAGAMERELREAKRQAEAANKATLNFLANISHELRTPLHAIIGFADLLRSPELALDHERCLEYCGMINDSGEHLLAIINDLLKLSQIEAGHMVLSESAAPADACVAGPVALITPLANQKRQELIVEVALEGVDVHADHRALRQVMLNILSNAVKFTDEGGRIAVTAEQGADGWLIYTVADNGIGMSEDDARRVLKPFEQVDSSLDRSQGGAGLGLPLAAGMVDAHGGALEIESAPGAGAKVIFRLPPTRVIGEGRSAA